MTAADIEHYFAELGIAVYSVSVTPLDLPCAEDDDWRDLAMIARDGPVAPKATTVALPAAPLTTAHKAVAGLTFLGPIGHLVDPSHLLKNN